MEKSSTTEKTSKLSKLIFTLSKTQDIFASPCEIENYFSILEDIYFSNNKEEMFRHYYSDIFGWLTQIDLDYTGEHGDLDVLSQNISIIKDTYEGCAITRERNVYRSISKLYDHINLDIARLNYLKTMQNSSNSQMEEINQQIYFLRQTVDEELEKAEDVGKKVNNAYSEFVSILGIFSAIVLVFFGGTSIFANIIAAMDKSSIYKSATVCIITGMMVADIIFIFMCLLSKLLNRNIANEVPEWEIYGNSVKRFRKRYPVVFYFNMMCMGILGLTYFAWFIKKYNILLIIKQCNDFWNNIIFNRQLVFDKKQLVFLIVLIFIISNLIFTVMYIFAKITDINIGWCINIKYPNAIYTQNNQKKYCVYKENWPMEAILLKEFSKEEQARRYMLFKIKLEKIRICILNLPKRIFGRYKVISFIDLLLIASLVIVCMM